MLQRLGRLLPRRLLPACVPPNAPRAPRLSDRGGRPTQPPPRAPQRRTFGSWPAQRGGSSDRSYVGFDVSASLDSDGYDYGDDDDDDDGASDYGDGASDADDDEGREGFLGEDDSAPEKAAAAADAWIQDVRDARAQAALDRAPTASDVRDEAPPRAAGSARRKRDGERSRLRGEPFALNKRIVDCASAAAVFDIYETRGEDFTPVNVATTLRRLAEFGCLGNSALSQSHAALLKDILAVAADGVSEWRPSEVASVCRACASAGPLEAGLSGADAIFDAVALTAPCRLGDFAPRHLAHVAWAFSTARVDAPQLFDALAAAASRKMVDFEPKDVASLAWSFSAARCISPALLEAVALEASKNISEYGAQALANTVWAFAKARVPAPALFQAVAEAAPVKLQDFKPAELAMMVWAFATARFKARAFFQQVAEHAVNVMQSFAPQNLANIAWAYATANAKAPELFHALAAEAEMKISGFDTQNLANGSVANSAR
ncbi:hypothetical protein M885DRAFT_36163 [Pelagophyceae sp. CCMP2097]|nr:hypothetical protein M885DRAFT_36163 [Pelagophyceae sp. CCMP2097]